MILILTEEYDLSSYEVMDWLNYYQVDFIQIDHKVPLQIIELKISDEEVRFSFKVRGLEYSSEQIEKVWYRRGELKLSQLKIFTDIDAEFDQSINTQLASENKEIANYIWNFFKSKALNIEPDNDINKLMVLDTCRKHGIRIPKSMVTTSKETLLKFKETEGEIISKNCNASQRMRYGNYYFTGYTECVSNEMIHKTSDYFSPTIFQKLIEKSFEVRTFYLEGEFYSSAIFSQMDEQTKVDFRNYNSKKPNWTPPYQLPKYLENQLHELMKEIKLNSGSIDLMVDNQGEYYFLEVNPVGQFAQVSKPCNYYLEDRVAQILIR